MSKSRFPPGSVVFGLADWIAWMDRMARAMFGMSGSEFEEAYRSGKFVDSGPAQDVGSAVQFIDLIRKRQDSEATTS